MDLASEPTVPAAAQAVRVERFHDDPAVRLRELGCELVNGVLADVPGVGMSLRDLARGRTLPGGGARRSAAFDRGPVWPVAVGIVRATLPIELALIASQTRLSKLECTRILNGILRPGRKHR